MAREMKNSGVEWLGDIPVNWQVRRVKDLYRFDTGFTPDTTNQAFYDDENGEDWACISDLQSRYVCNTKSKISQLYLNANRRSKVKKGSLLFSFKLSVGTVAFAGKDLYTNEAIAAFQQTPSINLNFLFYSAPICIVHNAAINIYGASILNSTRISNANIIVPPFDEQKVIADFLDAKCGEINGLLADLDAEVKTLTEYKKSLIAETVTRGLNPNAPMKKVSLGWIDELPANWSVARIASVYSVRNEKVSDQDFQPLSVTMKGIVPQLENAAKTKHGDDRKLIRKGDFVINSRSDRRGSCGISPYDGSCSLINTVLAPREEMNPRYYNWLFHTTQFADEFYKWGYGIVDDLWTTNWGAMRRIQIPMPPLEEQAEIAAYLDKKVPQIDETITLKQDQIETLKAYKASLIYEYVTGKKQVAL